MIVRFCAAAALTVFLAAAQTPSIHLDNGSFRVAGAPFDAEPAAGWSSVFRVYVSSADSQPVMGSYAVENGDLVFHPRFPIARVAYRAVFAPPGIGPIAAIFDPPPGPKPSTRVEQIYPTADVLPANALKLYICFSAPMSRGEAWSHIHLLDSEGRQVKLAFLEIEQELWDPDNRRLTVLFDPGRIKRGLVPALQDGLPIREGQTYTLVVDIGWHDGQGVPLAEGFRKTFRGGPVDRDLPEPRLWRIQPPLGGTTDPLVVDFPKPMDYALVQRMIHVPGVDGAVTISRNETEWRFTPATPWKPGSWTIVADNALEDVSGNRLNRAFDVDLKTASAAPSSKELVIPFTVR
ncbi:MAG TPA: hypothetical protein VKB79_23955 [Bryobacteraceae bacterium]|nr:hypothetical protein [Bryobacteraceae bacterium]